MFEAGIVEHNLWISLVMLLRVQHTRTTLSASGPRWMPKNITSQVRTTLAGFLNYMHPVRLLGRKQGKGVKRNEKGRSYSKLWKGIKVRWLSASIGTHTSKGTAVSLRHARFTSKDPPKG